MKTVENGRKTPQPFSTFTFEYENENKNGKAGHENERELTEYREFRKRTNSSGIMSNTVSIRKLLIFLPQPLHAMTRHLDKFRDFWTSFAFYIIKSTFLTSWWSCFMKHMFEIS